MPGFGRFWGKRRGWIMLAQLGIFVSMATMGLTASDQNLGITALFAVQSRGTAGIGKIVGPRTSLWLGGIALLGMENGERRVGRRTVARGRSSGPVERRGSHPFDSEDRRAC